jgi:hypothetical protein
VAFIRRRTVGGVVYYSVVENKRAGGKVRQKTLVSLGRCATVAEALEKKREDAAGQRRRVECGCRRCRSHYVMQQIREWRAEKKVAVLLKYLPAATAFGTTS